MFDLYQIWSNSYCSFLVYLNHAAVQYFDWFALSGSQDKDDLAVAFAPDYVIYQNTLYGEAELLFFPDSVLVKCLDVSGNNENFVLECAIADIIHIDCQWSSSVSLVARIFLDHCSTLSYILALLLIMILFSFQVGATLVKFHIRETTVNGNENVHNTCGRFCHIFPALDA